MKIQELAFKATESMISNGYKPITAWYTYENVLKNVVIEHERQNTDEYSEKAVSTYAEAVNRRYRNKEISYSHYRFLIGSVEKFLNFAKTGMWRKPVQGHKPKANRYFTEVSEALANEFAEVSNWTENTKSRYLGGVCKHFLWLENNGYYDLQKIDGDVIQRYFIYLLDAGCCGRTILNTKGYLYLYLPCSSCFSCSIKTRRRGTLFSMRSQILSCLRKGVSFFVISLHCYFKELSSSGVFALRI